MPEAADPLPSSPDAEPDRRQQIIQAAARAFARKGYHATTVKDIAAESNLSPGALYIYFQGKRDILTAFFEHAVGTAREQLQSAAQLDPRQALVAVVEERLGFLEANRNLVKVLISEALYDEELRGRLEEEIAGRVDPFVAEVLARCGPGAFDERQRQLVARTFQAQLIFWGVLWPSIAPSQTALVQATPAELATIIIHGVEGLAGQVSADE